MLSISARTLAADPIQLSARDDHDVQMLAQDGDDGEMRKNVGSTS
jgi:hypothetical protein